jgi:hypothetical protein
MATMAEGGFWAKCWDRVARDWRMILKAPALFGSATLLIIAGTAFVVWRGVVALDNAEIAGLKATIKADEATIQYQNIRLGAVSTTPALAVSHAEPDVDFSNLRPLSNASLRNETNDLAKSMRALEATYQNAEEAIEMAPHRNLENKQQMQSQWNDMMEKENKLELKENYEWHTQHRGRVLAIYYELCRRLGILPIQESALDMSNSGLSNMEAASLLSSGMLAGAYPISALADYLESLALQLH